MIEVNVKSFLKNVFQVVFHCPHCKKRISFYYNTPEYCEECYGKLPDIASLFDAGGGRIWYHRTGRTFRTSERVDRIFAARGV